MKNGEAVKRFKHFIREPYVWPGGYARVMLVSDWTPLHHSCAKANAKLIIRAIRDNDPTGGWLFIGDFVNWEDPDLYCGDCGQRIKSEYAEPD